MKIVTMKNLLQNPSGSQTAYFARRDLIIANLEDRYYNLVKTREVELDIYTDRGDYYFHLKVPSEKFTDDLTYDVVLQFIPIGGGTGDMSISNYAIKMYSNSPNFMFTYAYVFNKDGVIVDFTKEKLSKQCLTDEPKVKNPLQSYGFEKSVYFSLLYIKEKRLTLKSNINAVAKKLDKKKILKSITHSEEKLKEYQLLDKKEKEEKKRKREEEKKKKEAEKKKLQANARTKVSKTTVKPRKTATSSGSSTNRFKVKKPVTSTRTRKRK